MTAGAVYPPTRRIAVFGSIAAERPLVLQRDQALSPAARAVLERVLEAIAFSAPSIAKPVLDRAVADAKITRAERHALLLELSFSDDGVAREAAESQGARGTLREALAAIRRAAPAIAQPILDDAVDAERLTAAQEQRILERLRLGSLRRTIRPRFAPAVPASVAYDVAELAGRVS